MQIRIAKLSHQQLLLLFILILAKSSDEFVQVDINQVKNVLDNVIDIVQQASENKKCEFSCSSGFKKITNKSYIPISNGCGSLGVDVDFSHLPSLVNCCDVHDLCYGTCGKNRDDCDRNFYRCLHKACDQSKKIRKLSNEVLVSIDACKVTAEIIHQGVSALGCKSFLDAQKEACICVPQKSRFEL